MNLTNEEIRELRDILFRFRNTNGLNKMIAGLGMSITNTGCHTTTLRAVGAGFPYTVDNGLRENIPNNFQLGGIVLSDITLDGVTNAYNFWITGMKTIYFIADGGSENAINLLGSNNSPANPSTIIQGSNAGAGWDIDFNAQNGKIGFSSAIPDFDDDVAATLGGLTAGRIYQTTGLGAAPLNVAGILMIKQ